MIRILCFAAALTLSTPAVAQDASSSKSAQAKAGRPDKSHPQQADSTTDKPTAPSTDQQAEASRKTERASGEPAGPKEKPRRKTEPKKEKAAQDKPDEQAETAKSPGPPQAGKEEAASKKAGTAPAAEPKEQAPTKQVKKEAGEKKPGESKEAPKHKEKSKTQETGKQEKPIRFQPEWLKAMVWRSIGPASMGGRIVDIEVVQSNPFTFYVATASGGLFKTVNNGVTFAPVFQKENTVSIGDVAVSYSDPNILWVGTGEHNARNSASWGDGVYKSLDGGKTWRRMGLEKSFQIGRIAIHPTNPDIVYVGALGRLWGPNEERGLYKTTDGGETWEKVLYVDDKTGCIEVQMHPRDPNTLLAAMYQRRRDRFSGGDPAQRWGPGGGLYKTTDGGATWKRLTKGLPNRPLGRIGVSYFRNDPKTVYAIVESDKIGTGQAAAYMGITGGQEGAAAAIRGVVEGGPAAAAGLQAGDHVLEVDGEKMKTYNDLVVAIRKHKPDEKSTLKIKRGDSEKVLHITWGKRKGEAGARPYTSYLGGQRANAQGQQGPQGDQSGGVYQSTDAGESWKRINSLNPRPFYYSQIRVDPTDDQHLYVLGVSFHYSTNGGGEFRTGASRVHSDHHALWIDPRDGRHLVLGCDGGLYISYDRGGTWDFHNIMAIGQFYDVGVDTRNPYRVYGGLQDNGSWGGPSRKRGSAGPINPDWLQIGGGDGFVCRVDPDDPDLVYYESQYGRMGRVNVRTAARANIRPAAEKGVQYRFHWKTPFLLSHHNSKIFYCAGDYVFRSLRCGDDLRKISPKISLTDRGAATAIAESPRDPNLLYVGTDDGALWVTRDGGRQWKNVVKKVKLPGSFQVSSIEASRFAAGRAYVAFDGHRSDDDDPHIYVTEDSGDTWKPLNANLPSGATRCLREDAVSPNLLYCGTEFAIWVSLDRGGQWFRLNNNLPTVAVHEIAVHPTQGEIVAATHGRSLWVLDVAPLQQLTGEIASAKAHLFKPSDGVLWAGALSSNRFGHHRFVGRNPDFGVPLYYHLAEDAKELSLEIRDVQGGLVRSLKADPKAGLHRVVWNLRRSPPRAQQGQRGGGRYGPPAPPGTYLVKLVADDREMSQPIRVERDPEFPAALLQEELDESERTRRRRPDN